MATQASIDGAQEFYVAYTGCAADVAGIVYWSQQLDYTDDLSAPISAFGSFAGYVAEYSELDNDALINSLYQRLFNRDADEEGLAFYTGRLESGEATLANIPKQIMDGALGNDAEIFWNKIQTANRITEQHEYLEPWDGDQGDGLIEPICEEFSTIIEGALVVVAGVSEVEANSLFDI